MLLVKYANTILNIPTQFPRFTSKKQKEEEKEMYQDTPRRQVEDEQLQEASDQVNAERDKALEEFRAQREKFQAQVSKITTPIRKTYGAGLLSEKDFAKNRSERRRIVALIRRGERRYEKVSFRRAWRQLRQTVKTA